MGSDADPMRPNAEFEQNDHRKMHHTLDYLIYDRKRPFQANFHEALQLQFPFKVYMTPNDLKLSKKHFAWNQNYTKTFFTPQGSPF